MCESDRYTNNVPRLKFDENKNYTLLMTGPTYMVMRRTDKDANLANVSPFLIHKAIVATCGEVEECKKLRSGEILIKTKNAVQSRKLVKLVAISNTINVEIGPHKHLNQSKGVLYCNDLRGMPESEILLELKDQNVAEVKKILKKVNNELIETGLIILTFSTTEIPEKINIGFLKMPIRMYVPQPMRCKNCMQYNHLAKFCVNKKMCSTCGNAYHLIEGSNETCLLAKKCLNCSLHKIPFNNHAAHDRKCPVFLKEKEIQEIKTKSKVDNKTARKIYAEKHSTTTLFSTIVTNGAAPIHSEKPNINNANKTPQVRKINTYKDILSDNGENSLDIKRNKITVLPRSTSKRVVKQIKKKKLDKPEKTNGNILKENFKTAEDIDIDSSDYSLDSERKYI